MTFPSHFCCGNDFISELQCVSTCALAGETFISVYASAYQLCNAHFHEHPQEAIIKILA